MKTLSYYAMLSLLLLSSNACSIALALSGHKEPDFSVIDVGATRSQVEEQLGSPTSIKTDAVGNEVASYRYELGNAPNKSRALVHFYIDLATIGLYEPIGTLWELTTFRGHDHDIIVQYRSDGRVGALSGDMPADKLEQLRLQAKQTVNPSGSELLTEAGKIEVATALADNRFQDLAKRLSQNLKERGIGRVAVLPAEDPSAKGNPALARYVTDKLTAKIHDIGGLRVVERAALTKVQEELLLTHSGTFDEDSAKKIGKLLGVDAVITSTLSILGQHLIEVNSKTINVETGELLSVGSVQLQEAMVKGFLH